MKRYNKSEDKLLEIPVGDLCVWDKHIKKHYDMNLTAMSESLRLHGQSTPLIVRPKQIEGKVKYEIIDGLERYLAAQKLKKKFKTLYCLVRKLTDKQALLLQATGAENKKVSGYERALSYKFALFEESIKQKDLAEKLNIAKSTLTRRMSFLKIDKAFWDKIDDTSTITDTLSNQIVVIINKNKKFKTYSDDQLLKILVKICNNNPTMNDLRNLSRKIEGLESYEKIFNINSKEIYKVKDNSLHFNKEIITKINFKELLALIDKYCKENIS